MRKFEENDPKNHIHAFLPRTTINFFTILSHTQHELHSLCVTPKNAIKYLKKLHTFNVLISREKIRGNTSVLYADDN